MKQRVAGQGTHVKVYMAFCGDGGRLFAVVLSFGGRKKSSSLWVIALMLLISASVVIQAWKSIDIWFIIYDETDQAPSASSSSSLKKFHGRNEEEEEEVE